MGPVGYFIAILGCADGGSDCREAAILSTRYDSQAMCMAASGDALMANADLNFPTLFAECRPAARKSSTDSGPARLPEGAARA